MKAMESIREIVVPKNNKIELIVPDNFIGKRIEVIALEMEEEIDDSNRLKKKTFDAIELDFSDRPFTVANVKVENYKFDREEANER